MEFLNILVWGIIGSILAAIGPTQRLVLRCGYNHGMAIVEANGEKTRITVLGIHIIKTSDKVPWLGRGTAKTFAKNHYGNFVAAFKKVIEPKCVSKKDTK